MNRFFTKSMALVALVGAFSLFAAAKSEAAMSLKLTDNLGNTVTINDGGVGDLSGANAVTFAGALGVWFVNVSTGATNPGLSVGNMDLNSVNLASGAGTLEILFTQTGLNPPIPGSSLGATWGGTLVGNGSASAQLYGADSNAAFATTNLLASLVQVGSPFATSADVTIPVGYSGSYSLTQRMFITANGPINYSGDFQVIPEPASIALLGLGLAGMAARRRRQTA